MDVKILMLTHHYFPHVGGNGVQCKLLAEELYKSGFKITIVTKKHMRSLPSYDAVNGIDVHRIFCLSALFNKSVPEYLLMTFSGRVSLKLLSKIVARLFFYADELIFVIGACIRTVSLKGKIDIIHVHQSHWIAFCGVISARLTKKPVLIKDATLNGLNELNLMPFAGIMRKSIKNTAFFAAISSDIYTSLVSSGIQENRIFRASNGVQMPSLMNKVSKDNFDIIFVGNFNQGKIKGLDVLVQAIPAVIKEYPAARLIVLGKGDTSLFFDLMAENNIRRDKIVFMGRQETRDYYQKCAVFVLPSRSEGMSNALLEAMSYGMTCVSTNVSGSNDIIVNKFNGILIEPDNVRQLENILIDLFSDREFSAQLGKNARETIFRNYQMDKTARRYADIYKIILENK